MACKCGHLRNCHTYNRDWRVWEKCNRVLIDGERIYCNCSKYIFNASKKRLK